MNLEFVIILLVGGWVHVFDMKSVLLLLLMKMTTITIALLPTGCRRASPF